MISIVPHGEAVGDEVYMEEYSDGCDYYGAKQKVIIRRPTEYEIDCNYVIEYVSLPFPQKEAKTDANDVYEITIKSVEADENIQSIEDFSTEEYEFDHTSGRLVKHYIHEKSWTLKDAIRRERERGEEYYHVPETRETKMHIGPDESLEGLSRIVRYKDYNFKQRSDVNTKSEKKEREIEDISNIDRNHETPISLETIRNRNVPKGPDNRVPVVRGLFLSMVQEEGSGSRVFIDELKNRVSDGFGVTEQTASEYVDSLHDWYADITVDKGYYRYKENCEP